MKEFWGGLNRIINFQTSVDISKQQNQQHQRKLEGFVSKQLRLGIKVAESLQDKQTLTINLEKTQRGYVIADDPMDKLTHMQHLMNKYDESKIKPSFLIKHELRYFIKFKLLLQIL